MVDFEKLLKKIKESENKIRDKQEVKNMTENKQKKTKDEELENFAIQVTESKPFEFPEIDDGVYSAILKKVTLSAGLENRQGEEFDMLNWYFEVDGKEITGSSSAKVTTLSKSYGWIKAIKEKEPELNKDFSFKSLQGKSCQIIIKNKKITSNIQGKETSVNKPVVTDVLPAKK